MQDLSSTVLSNPVFLLSSKTESVINFYHLTMRQCFDETEEIIAMKKCSKPLYLSDTIISSHKWHDSKA